MRLKKITEADKDQIDVVFHIYKLFITSAYHSEDKDPANLSFHFGNIEELKAKCKREK